MGCKCWNAKIIFTKTILFSHLPKFCPSNFTHYTVVAGDWSKRSHDKLHVLLDELSTVTIELLNTSNQKHFKEINSYMYVGMTIV